MLAPPATEIEPSVQRRPAKITVLVVGQEGDHVERAFDDETAVVETVATVADARPRFDDADCLVVPSTVSNDSDTPIGDVAATTGADEHVEWLELIRTDAPALPVVVLADAVTSDLLRTVRSYEWTAVVEQDDPCERLATRVRDLLERHRLTVLSRRSLASLEFAGDAIALVDSDGTIQFASRSFKMQFGTDGDSFVGTPWQKLFTDDAVSHLESAALPTVADGWRWTGSCTGRRQTGVTFSARLRLGGLADGSLVFVLEEPRKATGSRTDQ